MNEQTKNAGDFGFRHFEFESMDLTAIEAFNNGDPCLKIETDDNDSVWLLHEQVSALAPLMAHFAENGRLPDPEAPTQPSREARLLQAIEAEFAHDYGYSMRGMQAVQFGHDDILALIAECRGETIEETTKRLNGL